MNVPSPAALAPVQEPTPKWWPWLRWVLVALCVLPLLDLAAPTLLGLPRYDVSGGQIVARSLASRTVIPAGTPVQKTELRLLTRNFGTSIAGYQVGRFTSDRGQVALYGNGSRTGLLFATRPPTFLTPADPDALLGAWQGGQTATFSPAPVRMTDNWWLLLLMLPAVAVVGSLFVSRPRLTYTIAGDTLTVQTRASRTEFPRGRTKASLTTDPLGVRLFGTGMPGYHTGTFGTRSGNVQAAASTARPTQALVLERDGKRFYLTPSDPAAVAAWFGEG